MEKEELEIREIFRQLTPENKLIQLAMARNTYIVQENTKRQYGIRTPHGGGPVRPGAAGQARIVNNGYRSRLHKITGGSN
jgi:hypothetical protein